MSQIDFGSWLSEYRSAGIGNLEGMGYSSFAAWMRNDRTSKSRIRGSAMRGMGHFLENWKGWGEGNTTKDE